MSRIVVLGASGHTGTLVVRDLVEAGAEVVIGTRNPGRADPLPGVSTLPFDAAVSTDVAPLVSRSDVVVNCIGRYSDHGYQIARAAVRAGAHYIDCAAEPTYQREIVQNLDGEARDAGVCVLPGFGFVSALGHVTAARAARRGGEAVRSLTTLYVYSPRAASIGTMRSALQNATEPAHSLVGGRLVRHRMGAITTSAEWAGRGFVGLAIGTSEPLLLSRILPEVPNISTFYGASGVSGRAFTLGARGAAQLGSTKSGARMMRRLSRSVERPARRDGFRDSVLVLTTAFTANGRFAARSGLAGGCGYDVTAALLSASARRVAEGRSAGVLGPLEIFSEDELIGAVQRSGMYPVPDSEVDEIPLPCATRVTAMETEL